MFVIFKDLSGNLNDTKCSLTSGRLSIFAHIIKVILKIVLTRSLVDLLENLATSPKLWYQLENITILSTHLMPNINWILGTCTIWQILCETLRYTRITTPLLWSQSKWPLCPFLPKCEMAAGPIWRCIVKIAASYPRCKSTKKCDYTTLPKANACWHWTPQFAGTFAS